VAVQIALCGAGWVGMSVWGLQRPASDGSLCMWVLLTDNFSMDLSDGSVATVIVSGHQAPAILFCVCVCVIKREGKKRRVKMEKYILIRSKMTKLELAARRR
jgi:hypothetical protein